MKTVALALGFLLASGAMARAQGADGVCVKHISVPTYPPLARAAGVQGTVQVDVSTGSDGKVRSAKASGGRELINKAAEENMREWIFCSSAQGNYSTKYVYLIEEQNEPTRVSFDLPEEVKIVTSPVRGGY